MKSEAEFEENKAELLEEFYDLQDKNVVLDKELYAHFGLLFFKFSLVEHSLINALMMNHVGTAFGNDDIKTQAQWEDAFDVGYENACNLTFGNMIKQVLVIQEFSGFRHELQDLKQARNYFTHRFFRDDVGIYSNDEGIWLLLVEIAKFRKMTMKAEDLLRPAFEALCGRH